VFSNKSTYALRALAVLAKKYGKEPVLIGEISRLEKIPQKFLELILLELKQNGYLESKKGIHGGYWLAKPPDEIIIGNIIRILDGPLPGIRCNQTNPNRPCEGCPGKDECRVNSLMNNVTNAVSHVLDNYSLSEFAA